MNVLADHCLPEFLVEALRRAGCRVVRVVDVVDPRATDHDVAALALRLDAVLVTSDQDFLRRSAFQPRRYAGIIVLKDLCLAPERLERRLLRAVARKRLRGCLLVLDARSARWKR